MEPYKDAKMLDYKIIYGPVVTPDCSPGQQYAIIETHDDNPDRKLEISIDSNDYRIRKSSQVSRIDSNTQIYEIYLMRFISFSGWEDARKFGLR